MLALQFPQLGAMELVEAPIPKIGANDLLVRVSASGICGTDQHILHGVFPATFPLIPGHEYSGVVEAVGAEVDGFQVGDHVAVDPNILCGVCSFCRAGKVHLCKNLVALGVNLPGGFAEYSRVPANQAYLLPKSLSLSSAALAEPLACCLRGMDLAEVKSGDRVLIFGAGPMGAIILQLAQMQGASFVGLVEPQKRRRERVEALGADWVIDPLQDSPAETILSEFPDGVEVVFDCSGNIHAIRQTLRVVMRGGTVVLYGVCDREMNLEINPYWINDNEITIRGSFCNPNTMGRAVDLLARRKIKAEEVVTDEFPMSEAVKAFSMLGAAETLKVVIRPDISK